MVDAVFDAYVISLGYALCAVAYPVAALAAWRSRFENIRKAAMVCACLLTSLWALALALPPPQSIAAELPKALEVARSAAWCVFFLISLGVREGLWRGPAKHGTAQRMVWTFVFVLLLTGVVILLARDAGAGALVGIWQIAASIATLLLIENLLRNCSPESLWGVRMICFPIGFQAAYDLFFYTTLFATSHVDPVFLAARGYLAVAGVPFLVAAMLRRSRWGGDIGLSRNAMFHSTALIGAGAYLVAVAAAGQYLGLHGGSWGFAFEAAFLAVAAVILVIALESAAMRVRLLSFISKYSFRLKYDYRSVWREFIHRMVDPEARMSLPQRTLRAVADVVDCRSGILWMLQPEFTAYAPAAALDVADPRRPMIPAEDDLPRFLAACGWVLDVPQWSADPGAYEDLTMPPWLSRLVVTDGAWIVAPLIHNQVLEAFVVLCNPRSGRRFPDWEDLDVLKTVGAQAASYLAEARASRELLETRRFAEANRRFAFMAHDIKNVVGQMAMMLQNAERFGGDPDFQKDMLLTIGSATDRLRMLLVKLSGDAPPQSGVPHAIDLGAMVDGVVARWRKSFPDLEYAGAPAEVNVSATEDGIATVLDHLIQNAVEAAGKDGGVRVAVSATAAEGVVEIIDDGVGMTPEFIREHLFRPHATSKSTGTGLGAFQAMRTVRDMGGRLDVDSTPGGGTTMRVALCRIAGTFATESEAAHAESNAG